MKQTLIAIAASVALLTASHASAQAIEGFVTGGTHRDSNREQFTGLAGKGFSEFKGRMYGAGVDFRPRNSRIGVRASYHAYLANVWNRPEKHVQPSVSVGVIWTASRVAAEP